VNAIERGQVGVADVANGVPIHVVATTLEGTRDAIAAADVLASATDSRVYVIARGAVPDGVTLEPPTDRLHMFARTIRDLPEASSARLDVLACLYRRPADLLILLPPRAIVFIGGGSRRWWPTPEQRLAHEFTRIGCRVVFIHAETCVDRGR
jgi:hypothetical protein